MVEAGRISPSGEAWYVFMAAGALCGGKEHLTPAKCADEEPGPWWQQWHQTGCVWHACGRYAYPGKQWQEGSVMVVVAGAN